MNKTQSLTSQGSHVVGEGQAQGVGGTEERALAWTLEVREGFLGKLTSKLEPKSGRWGSQERRQEEECQEEGGVYVGVRTSRVCVGGAAHRCGGMEALGGKGGAGVGSDPLLGPRGHGRLGAASLRDGVGLRASQDCGCLSR